MGVLKSVFAVAACIAVLAYVTRPAFPDTASNRHIKFLAASYLRLVTVASRIGDLLGIASPVNITRYFYDMSRVILNRETPGVEEVYMRFTDLIKVMFTDAEGEGDHHCSTVTKTTMDGVEVLIFQPSTPRNDLRPGIVHFHGGGFVLMSPETYAPVCSEIAKRTQSVVVSVNYRLAPEHPFPGAINDCLTVTRYFLQNAEQYGVDKDSIGVKGDSAGGNLAMGVALQLAINHDGSLPKLKFLSLDYPGLQAVDFNLPSHVKHANGPGMIRKDSIISFCLMYVYGSHDQYLHGQLATNNHTSASFKASEVAEFVNPSLLPKEFQDEMKDTTKNTGGNDELFNELKDIFLDPLFMPLMATDEQLSLLPPTYIVSAEFDVVRDDAFLAAARLRKVGVKVKHNHFPAEEHGFLSFLGVDQNARDEFTNFARLFEEAISE